MANTSTRTLRLLVELSAKGSYKPQAAELKGLSKAATDAQTALGGIGKGAGNGKVTSGFQSIGQAARAAVGEVNQLRATQDAAADAAIRVARGTGDYGRALALVKTELGLAEQGSDRYNAKLIQQYQVQAKVTAESAKVAAGHARVAQEMSQAQTAQERLQDSAIRAARATGDYAGALRLVQGELSKTERDGQRYNKLIADQASITKQSMREIAKAAGDAGPAFSAFGQIATGALREIGKLAVDVGLKAGAALVKFGADSIGVAGDFEATMNRFESKTGTLDQAGLSLDNFREKFLKLGADSQYSAQQAGDAAIELVKGGVSIEQVMGGATDATLALAAAGELGLAPAAGIVAKQLGVWQTEAGGAANVANRLSQAANASVVDVDELALGLANVGGVARAAGLSFDETVTAMGLIAPGFSSASDAGTSLKVLLTALQPVTKTASAAFRELGLLTEQGTSKFYDAQGSFVGMTKATEILAEATRDLSEADQTRLVKLAFGQDAQRAALELAKQGAEGYDAFAKSMDKVGTAVDQAAKLNRGFNFAMEQLGGSLETAQIVIGSKLLPAGTALINDFFIPAVNGAIAVADNIHKVGEVIDTFGVPALAALTAGATAYALSVGGATLATYPFGIALQVVAGQAAAATLSFLALAIPIAAIGVSIGAVVFGIQNYNKQVDGAIAGTLAAAKGYGQADAAMVKYAESQDALASLGPKARIEMELERMTVQRLQSELRKATDAYYAIGGGTAENEQRIYDLNNALKEHAPKLDALVTKNKGLADANAQNAEAMRMSREGLVNFSAAAGQGISGAEAMALALRPVGEEAEKLYDALAKIYGEGFGFFAESVQGTVDYQAQVVDLTAAHNLKMEELKKTGTAKQIETERAAYATQMQDAALAYAQQEAAQLASLGRQLMAYTQTQGQLNGITQAKIDEMNAIIAEGYGVQVSATERAYGQMMTSIDVWAATGGKGSQEVVAGLIATGVTAVDTQQKMDALAKQYTAELIHNFDPAKDDVDELSAALSRIPARVNAEVNVHTSYSQSGNPPPAGSNVRYGGDGGAIEARAAGGPVGRGRPYWVGDNKDGSLNKTSELFVPKQSGWIVPMRQAMRGMGAMRSAQPQRAGGDMFTGIQKAQPASRADTYAGMTRAPRSNRADMYTGAQQTTNLGTYARSGSRGGSSYIDRPGSGGSGMYTGSQRTSAAPQITLAPGAVVLTGTTITPRDVAAAVSQGIATARQQWEAEVRAMNRGRR